MSKYNLYFHLDKRSEDPRLNDQRMILAEVVDLPLKNIKKLVRLGLKHAEELETSKPEKAGSND